MRSKLLIPIVAAFCLSALVTSAYAASIVFSSGMTKGPTSDWGTAWGWHDMPWGNEAYRPRIPLITTSGTTFYSGGPPSDTGTYWDLGRVWITYGGITDRGSYPLAPYRIIDVGDYFEATLSTNKGYTVSYQEFAVFMHDVNPSSSSDREFGFIFNGWTDNSKFRVYVQYGYASTGWQDVSSNSPLINSHNYKAIIQSIIRPKDVWFIQDGVSKANFAAPTIGNSWLTVGYNHMKSTQKNPNWTMRVTSVKIYGG